MLQKVADAAKALWIEARAHPGEHLNHGPVSVWEMYADYIKP